MTTSAGALPSYQRFANGVPVPLFTRRSFRPREKYLILLVFVTFGIVCFGAFFFLPDFRTGGAAVNSVYRVYQRMQKAGPELLLPVPPRASGDDKDSRSPADGHPNAVPPGHEDSDHQDVHLVEDKQKLQAKIDEEYQQQKTLEKPDMGESRVRTSSSSSLIVHKEETILVTVPPAPADKLPLTVGGEDKDHVARQRRDKVKEGADGRGSEERKDSIESSQSFHLLLCHRSFMASAFDKAPDEASRKTDKSANKSGL